MLLIHSTGELPAGPLRARRRVRTSEIRPLMLPHRERLLELLRERSLERGDFVLSSGARSDLYIDCRRTTMHSEGQTLVGRLAWEALRTSGLAPDCVGGLTMGADPVAYSIAYTSWLSGRPVDAFSVRKQAKEHGRGRRIEGCFSAGDRVVVIEDVITSGGSALDACAAVEAEGGKVLAVLAVLDREEGGRTKIESAGYPVMTLFRVSELLSNNATAAR
jgi:orotate phosphoribosyltransferase